MLSAVKIGLHLAKKSAGLHGCKREVAALTAHLSAYLLLRRVKGPLRRANARP